MALSVLRLKSVHDISKRLTCQPSFLTQHTGSSLPWILTQELMTVPLYFRGT